MKSEQVTRAWEFYRDNCAGYKESMRKEMRKLDDYVASVEAENDKLRELVRDALMPRLLYAVYKCPDEDMQIHDAAEWAVSELHRRAKELGIRFEIEVEA